MNWLFIRGLSRTTEHWAEFPRIFESEIPQSKVWLLDLPGVGSEAHRPTGSSISAITDDLRSRWKEISKKSEEPWSILGLSLGGMIALDWMNRFQSDFQAGVLMNTSSRDLSTLSERFNLQNFRTFLKIFSADSDDERERLILSLTTHLYRGDPILAKSRWSTFVVVKQLFAAARFCAPTTIKTRALFLASKTDHLVSPESSLRLAKKLSAAFELHPAAGHDLPLEDPKWICAKIREWL